jgi:hypothetical protein
MPLRGGPSEKSGNSYERRWTVFALIDLLGGQASALRIEVPGEDGVGSEFRLMVEGVAEWHQAKRQRAAGPWTINALITEGALPPWQANLRGGARCVFVASTGADELRELADRARKAESSNEFDTEFLAAKDVRAGFERLERAWKDLPKEDVYLALRRVRVRAIGESELADWINDRLRALMTGAEPATVAAVLGQLADDSVHNEVLAADVWAHLAKHGVAPRDLSRDAAVLRRVADSADAHLARLRPLYIGGHELERSEAYAAAGHLCDGRRIVIAGAAGAGKSVVAAQVVSIIRERQWPVLVLSADRLPDAATSTQLGVKLELPESPATVLAAVAAEGDALLVIDQLDAVSVTSGRHPERLGLIGDLLREARSYPRLRTLLAGRRFDMDNDRALRAVAHEYNPAVVTVGSLEESQTRQVLANAGVSGALPAPLMQLLAVPLHLALFVELAQAGVSDLASARTLTQLYDRYWNMKRDACRLARGGTDEWLPVIARLVERMNDRQELSVPEPVVDHLDQQVRLMASEGVLIVDQGRVTFFHETFFDYCFARQFLASGGSLRGLLISSEQDLFRRAQVRQILAYERNADVSAYLADLGWLLTSPGVRLHIKALVVALLDNVPDPTSQEWQQLRPLATDPQWPLHLRLWRAIRKNPGWFPVLDTDGTWATLLRAGGDLADRALWALAGCAADHAVRVSDLLADAPTEVWSSRRRWFLGVADVHRARELVHLLILAINDGDFDDLDMDLSYILRHIAQAQPAWGAEVLAAFIHRAAADEATNPFDPSRRFRGTSWDGLEVNAIANGAPADYVDRLLPLLLDAMRANARPDWQTTELVHDALWSHLIYREDLSLNLNRNLFDAMGDALARLAEVDPVHATTVFARLRAQPYESAAFLLARGYGGNPAVFADEAANWLATTPGARLLGFLDAPAWVTRELVAAISPQCSPAAFDQLVDALLYYAPRYERTYDGLRTRGITELCLLNAIASARRPARANRRLTELRRKFGHDDVGSPRGVTGGSVPPPIPKDRARRMSDRHWLIAMQHYGASDTTNWRNGRLVGDAWTQASVLEALTKEDPQRFARLLLRIPTGTAEAYVSAILRGLADERIDRDLLVEVCRHVQRLGGSEVNRWLVRLIKAHAAGPLEDEIIEMVAAIAIGDHDPAPWGPDEGWDGGSSDGAALNSTRSAAALAIGTLLAEEPSRLPLVVAALRRLVADPQAEVRAAAAASLVPLLYSDPDLAFAMFKEVVDQAPDELLGSHYVHHFLRNAVQLRRYPHVAELLHRMLEGPDDNTRQAAARWVTLAGYYDPNLDNVVDNLLTSDDDTTRAAAAEVFADNVAHAPRRDRTIAVLSAALNDPVKDVRDAAQRAFYQLDDQPLAGYAPLIAAFAGSPALADGVSAALHTLESSRQPLPAAILDVCEAFISAHQHDIGDTTTAAAGAVTSVIRLTLRVHAQHSSRDVRRRCLDLVDQLVVLGAHNIEFDLDSMER